MSLYPYKHAYQKYMADTMLKEPFERWLNNFCSRGLLVRGNFEGDWYTLYNNGHFYLPVDFKPFTMCEASICSAKAGGDNYKDAVYNLMVIACDRIYDDINDCMC